MVQQINNNNNKILRKIKRSAEIKYHLKLAGITQKRIADELKLSAACVSLVISGYGSSKKVDRWLKENLGV